MKSIELFAGAGGLAFGTAEAGFKHKVVIEWDLNACHTLRRNHDDGVRHVKKWEIIQGDVADFDFSPYRNETDFVCGGPPCQPFSLGGKHQGHTDNRNMFPQAIRAVREVRPKAFIFENVKGLLRKNFANYYSYIIHQLCFPTVTLTGDEDWTNHLARLERLHTKEERVDLRYNVVYQVVNAVNYGIPQQRWRVFIVGIRSDLKAEFCFPQPTYEEDALLHDKWISGEYWERQRIPMRRRPEMPGQPDIVLTRHQKVILIHGCYRHQHGICRPLVIPRNNPEFWRKKFAENVERDKRNMNELKELGWQVLVVWECETKDVEALEAKLRDVLGQRYSLKRKLKGKQNKCL